MVIEQPQCSPNARFTPSEAAKTLGVSRGTIYNYIKGGVFIQRDMIFHRTGRITILGTGIIRAWNTK